MKDSRIILFSTDYCTLCDAALDLLFSMPELRGLQLDVLDVADDDELLCRYGERLPVVRIAGEEFDWPFTSKQISTALRKVE